MSRPKTQTYSKGFIMSFYRGKSLQGSNSSNAEDDLFMDALAAHSKGLLPQTPQTDLEIPLVDDNGELFKSRPDWAFPSIRLLAFFDGPRARATILIHPFFSSARWRPAEPGILASRRRKFRTYCTLVYNIVRYTRT